MTSASALAALDTGTVLAEHLRPAPGDVERATRLALRGAGIRPGMRCLDAGCGRGERMRVMGELVGPEGEVWGVERGARRHGLDVLDWLEATSPARYTWVDGDASALDELHGARFHVVLARLGVLGDPVATVRRLATLARPRGHLVLLEHLGGPGVDPALLGPPPAAYTVAAGLGLPDGSVRAGGVRAVWLRRPWGEAGA